MGKIERSDNWVTQKHLRQWGNMDNKVRLNF